jgi:hypothetical protein
VLEKRAAVSVGRAPHIAGWIAAVRRPRSGYGLHVHRHAQEGHAVGLLDELVGDGEAEPFVDDASGAVIACDGQDDAADAAGGGGGQYAFGERRAEAAALERVGDAESERGLAGPGVAEEAPPDDGGVVGAVERRGRSVGGRRRVGTGADAFGLRPVRDGDEVVAALAVGRVVACDLAADLDGGLPADGPERAARSTREAVVERGERGGGLGGEPMERNRRKIDGSFSFGTGRAIRGRGPERLPALPSARDLGSCPRIGALSAGPAGAIADRPPGMSLYAEPPLPRRTLGVRIIHGAGRDTSRDGSARSERPRAGRKTFDIALRGW